METAARDVESNVPGQMPSAHAQVGALLLTG